MGSRRHVHPLIDCHDLSIRAWPGGKTLVKAATLQLFPQERIGVMGDSGSGKTTLTGFFTGAHHGLELAAGRLLVKPVAFFTLFQDADLHFSSYQTLFYYLNNAFIQRKRLVFRNPFQGFWARNFEDHIDYGFLADLMRALELDQKLDCDLQDRLQFRDFLRRSTKNRLSGGQQQKFLLLLASIAKPDVLIADEIFTDMDEGSVEDAVRHIFSGQAGDQVILVSHKIALMHRLIEEGKLHRIYFVRKGRTHVDVWTAARRPEWAEEMLEAHREIEAMIAKRRQASINRQGLPLFQANAIKVSLSGKDIIDAPNGFQIFSGRNYALKGSNGVGKTTLFKTLLKLYPYRGRLAHRRGELSAIPRYVHVLRNQLVFQKTGNAIQTRQPLGTYLLSFFSRETQPQKAALLQDLARRFFKQEAEDILGRSFVTLSVGEQRRILLIRAMLFLQSDGVLFIDEAMRGMDIFLKRDLIKYIRTTGSQVFLITHDKQLMSALCDEVIHIQKNERTGFKTRFECEVLS